MQKIICTFYNNFSTVFCLTFGSCYDFYSMHFDHGTIAIGQAGLHVYAGQLFIRQKYIFFYIFLTFANVELNKMLFAQYHHNYALLTYN